MRQARHMGKQYSKKAQWDCKGGLQKRQPTVRHDDEGGDGVRGHVKLGDHLAR